MPPVRAAPLVLATALLGCANAAPVPYRDFVPYTDPATSRAGYRLESGEIVIPARFSQTGQFSFHGIAAVADEEGWAFIDARGDVVIRPLNVDNGPDPFSEGLARFVSDGKFGFFDLRGRVVISPRFDFAGPFSDGRAAFCSGCVEAHDDEHRWFAGGGWGFVDRDGKVMISARFERVESFVAGRAKARTGGRWVVIDREGHVIPDEHAVPGR